jgi:hypothetical protein
MATRAAQGNRGASRSAAWRDGVKRGAKRSGTLLGGSILVVLGLVALVALASYRPGDPSFNTASAGPVSNWMGWSGAYGADLLLSLFGPGAASSCRSPSCLACASPVAPMPAAGAARWR